MILSNPDTTYKIGDVAVEIKFNPNPGERLPNALNPRLAFPDTMEGHFIFERLCTALDASMRYTMHKDDNNPNDKNAGTAIYNFRLDPHDMTRSGEEAYDRLPMVTLKNITGILNDLATQIPGRKELRGLMPVGTRLGTSRNGPP